MDALTRVTCYFPFQSISSFWILSNLIINNEPSCDQQTRSLIVAVIVLFSIFVVLASFTDTYTASNNMKYVVLLVPFYGPVCLSLPSDLDKDRVYDHFYLKIRDYIRSFIALIAFVLIVLFINPIAMCLYPSDTPGSSRMDPSIVRTVPVVVALITALMMICLGPPRQSLGFQNVEETCPPLEKQMGDNPIFNHAGRSSMPTHVGTGGGFPQGSVLDEDEERGYQSGHDGGHDDRRSGPSPNIQAVYGNGPPNTSGRRYNDSPPGVGSGSYGAGPPSYNSNQYAGLHKSATTRGGSGVGYNPNANSLQQSRSMSPSAQPVRDSTRSIPQGGYQDQH